MPKFTLDPRLQRDSIILDTLEFRELLLMDNAHYRWLIFVPFTQHTEWFELDQLTQLKINRIINHTSQFIKQTFKQHSEKLNIGMLGNIVNQMHIHIIGRNTKDPAWPGPAAAQPPLRLSSVGMFLLISGGGYMC